RAPGVRVHGPAGGTGLPAAAGGNQAGSRRHVLQRDDATAGADVRAGHGDAAGDGRRPERARASEARGRSRDTAAAQLRAVPEEVGTALPQRTADVRRVPRAAVPPDGAHGFADAVAVAGDATSARRTCRGDVRRSGVAGPARRADGWSRAAVRPRPARPALLLLRRRAAAARRGNARDGPFAIDRGPGAR